MQHLRRIVRGDVRRKSSSRDLAFRILVELYGGEMPKFEDEPAECMQAALLKCERTQTDVREVLAQIQSRLCGEP